MYLLGDYAEPSLGMEQGCAVRGELARQTPEYFFPPQTFLEASKSYNGTLS